jgi:hypothetical protein
MEFSTYTLKLNNYNIDVISDDLYIRHTLSAGYEWDGWMRQVPFIKDLGYERIISKPEHNYLCINKDKMI